MAQQQPERVEHPDLQAFFRRALKERNLTINAASIRLGIDRQSIYKMDSGIATRLEIVERFARGLRYDVNYARVCAGYPAVESLSDEFLRRVVALKNKYGVSPRLVLNEGPESLTRERMEEYLADMELMMQREAAELAQKDEGERDAAI